MRRSYSSTSFSSLFLTTANLIVQSVIVASGLHCSFQTFFKRERELLPSSSVLFSNDLRHAYNVPSAEVASSKSSIFGLDRTARAMATLYRKSGRMIMKERCFQVEYNCTFVSALPRDVLLALMFHNAK